MKQKYKKLIISSITTMSLSTGISTIVLFGINNSANNYFENQNEKAIRYDKGKTNITIRLEDKTYKNNGSTYQSWFDSTLSNFTNWFNNWLYENVPKNINKYLLKGMDNILFADQFANSNMSLGEFEYKFTPKFRSYQNKTWEWSNGVSYNDDPNAAVTLSSWSNFDIGYLLSPKYYLDTLSFGSKVNINGFNNVNIKNGDYSDSPSESSFFEERRINKWPWGWYHTDLNFVGSFYFEFKISPLKMANDRFYFNLNYQNLDSSSWKSSSLQWPLREKDAIKFTYLKLYF